MTALLDHGLRSSVIPAVTLRSPLRQATQPAQPLPYDGITVVLFAGLGGACAGLEEAGCPVHVANNHDAVALAAHAALHPRTRHIRGDIFDVDPIAATGRRRVKVLWASPDCRDHSVAKGGAPRSARVRSLPWQVCRWIGKTSPDVVMMENVREIRGWGPLIAKRDRATGRVLKLDGTVAAKGERVPQRQQQLVRDPSRLGRSYRRFVAHIHALGLQYEDRDLCCADFGVPTSRRRWFAIARKDGLPIRWPERTHAPRHQAAGLGLLPWVPAADIIDWSLPLPSIFERKRPLAEATLRRVATGLRRFVLEAAEPFIIPLTHHGAGRVYSASETLRTVTGAHRGELAVVGPAIVPLTHTTASSGNQAKDACAAPLQTMTTAKGGEFAVCAPYVQTFYGQKLPGEVRGVPPSEPLGTLSTCNRVAVVGAFMAQHNLNAVGVSIDRPVSTLTTAGTQQQLAAGYLTHLRGTSTACAAGGPLRSITAGGGHFAATAAFLAAYGGVDDGTVVTTTISGQLYGVADIGMRMLAPHEAAAAHELRLPELIEIGGRRRPLTKTEAMRLIGNSVPKRMARLLAEANALRTRHAGVEWAS